MKKDFPLFYDFMKNETATKYLLFGKEDRTDEGINVLFHSVIDSYETDSPIYSLVVAHKKDDRFLGSVGLAEDFSVIGYQIYWSVLPDHWNKGYATEGAKALLTHAIQSLHMKSLKSYSHPKNFASLRVAEKIGMENLGEKYIDATKSIAVVYAKRV